jgi:L-lactate dehydrogenase complex protein LldF
MGVEKVVPRLADLAVFLRLLARSATGQPVTSYTSHFHGPAAGGELHVVIVDAGRSAIMADAAYRRSLACIRCGACLNTCPVFRRSGGYSYGYVIPGPIGSLLGVARDPRAHASLPFASTLCGSCDDVCPVKIDIHGQLLERRRELGRQGIVPLRKRLAMRLVAWVLARRWAYEWGGRLARVFLRLSPRAVLYGPWNAWGRRRELPEAPVESFREIWRRTRGRSSRG